MTNNQWHPLGCTIQKSRLRFDLMTFAKIKMTKRWRERNILRKWKITEKMCSWHWLKSLKNHQNKNKCTASVTEIQNKKTFGNVSSQSLDSFVYHYSCCCIFLAKKYSVTETLIIESMTLLPIFPWKGWDLKNKILE